MNRTPRDEARSGRHHRGAWLAALLLATTAGACKKEKKEDPLGIPPPRGAASTDELSTSLGQARALNTGLVPTTTRWLRTFVLDDKRAVLIGEIVNETIALTTENAGRTWQALRLERDGWSTWSLGADGSAAVVLGTPAAAKPSNDPRAAAAAPPTPASAAAATEEPVRIAFAAFAAPQLSALAPVIIPARKPKAQHPVDLIPAVLGPDRAALVMEEAPRRWMLAYGGLAGAEEAAPLKLPPTEQAVTTPYGRPPMLLSARGRDLFIRPIPDPQGPLATPQKVPGVVVTPPVLAQLSTAPACDMGAWSFQILSQPRPMVLAVSKDKTTLFPLPARPTRNTFGCVGNQLAVEIEDPTPLDLSDPTADPKKRVSTLAICTLEGQCSVPQKPPFRPWVEPHERTMMAAPTKQGAVAVLTSRSPTRWGLYLSQSVDGGKLYEVPRVIGEGMGDRGRIEIGAVLSFDNRILLLLEADVTGTSRRGWYVTASDDGGLTWGVP